MVLLMPLFRSMNCRSELSHLIWKQVFRSSAPSTTSDKYNLFEGGDTVDVGVAVVQNRRP